LPFVNRSGNILCVLVEVRHSSADNHLEALRAEEKLAQMDIAEDLATLAESEECPRLRHQLANQYRRVVGVAAESREELRAAMERVKMGGGVPVVDVIEQINRDVHANLSF
jgi:hypothetical protein